MIKKYIKKPAEVEAIQLTEDNIIEVLKYVGEYKYLYLEKDEDIVKRIIEKGYFEFQLFDNTDMYGCVGFGDFIVKDEYSEYKVFDEDEFKELYQSVDNFIDLNKLKNYICFTESADIMTQYSKIKEEINEFYLEFIYKPNGEKIIAEGLDVMTAMYNYLDMIGLTKEDFEKHITKLNKYKETKYKR